MVKSQNNPESPQISDKTNFTLDSGKQRIQNRILFQNIPPKFTNQAPPLFLNKNIKKSKIHKNAFLQRQYNKELLNNIDQQNHIFGGFDLTQKKQCNSIHQQENYPISSSFQDNDWNNNNKQGINMFFESNENNSLSSIFFGNKKSNQNLQKQQNNNNINNQRENIQYNKINNKISQYNEYNNQNEDSISTVKQQEDMACLESPLTDEDIQKTQQNNKIQKFKGFCLEVEEEDDTIFCPQTKYNIQQANKKFVTEFNSNSINQLVTQEKYVQKTTQDTNSQNINFFEEQSNEYTIDKTYNNKNYQQQDVKKSESQSILTNFFAELNQKKIQQQKLKQQNFAQLPYSLQTQNNSYFNQQTTIKNEDLEIQDTEEMESESEDTESEYVDENQQIINKNIEMMESYEETEQIYKVIDTKCNIMLNNCNKLNQNSQSESNKSVVTEDRRCILTDWIMELGYDHGLRRDTVYNAIQLQDLYYQKVQDIQKSDLQLISGTCLWISCKQEEVISLHLENFMESTKHAYTQEQFIQMELQILNKINWKTQPVSINMWLNLILETWDSFFEQRLQDLVKSEENILFKKFQDKMSYNRLLEINNIIDAQQLDCQTFVFSNKLIVLSLLYLFVGLYLGIFQQQIVFQQFYNSSKYLSEEKNQYFNDIYQEFLNIFNIQTIQEILPSIQYCSTFFKVSNYPTNMHYDFDQENEKSKKIKQNPCLWEQMSQNMLYNESHIEYIKFRKQYFSE